jgi:DNA-binding NarL/FixJ family response regulator
MNENNTIRIFLADDHPLLRTGLRLSLDQQEGVELIGEAEDGFSAVEKIQANPPDVSLIDVDMPGLSGIEAIRVLRKSLPQMKIIVLSTYSDDTYIRESMEAGADGYVLKCVGINELVKIIKSFWSGKPELSPYLVNLTRGYIAGETIDGQETDHGLTAREIEILQCITEGNSNKDIAAALFISIETVKSHVKHIYKKLNVNNRVEAARIALQQKLLV